MTKMAKEQLVKGMTVVKRIDEGRERLLLQFEETRWVLELLVAAMLSMSRVLCSADTLILVVEWIVSSEVHCRRSLMVWCRLCLEHFRLLTRQSFYLH